jgi:hypothetical protein
MHPPFTIHGVRASVRVANRRSRAGNLAAMTLKGLFNFNAPSGLCGLGRGKYSFLSINLLCFVIIADGGVVRRFNL